MSNIIFNHLPHDICRVTSSFGYRTNPVTSDANSYHQGIDIGAKVSGVQGDELYAVADGRVVYTAYMASTVYGYGYFIIIEHEGYCTLYAHMKGLMKEVGDKVMAGQIVGYMGSTGASTAAHLHFEVETIPWTNYTNYIAKEDGIRKYAVDPYQYIKDYLAREDEAVAKLEELEKKIKNLESEVEDYDKVKDMPEWMQEHVRRWQEKGYIKGDDGGNLDLSRDMIRTLIVVERMIED